MLPYKHIAIEGNIGAGKTSFSERLSKEMSALLILEQFTENPFLELFYQNKERYAFQVELFFLADRYEQIRRNVSNDLFGSVFISDYIFDKCFIFASNNLLEPEIRLYRNLFDIMRGHLPQPDLIIYLNHSTNRLLKQIEQRGRSFEKLITADYLDEIRNSYFTYFSQSTQSRIVVVDCEELDFIKNETDYLKIKSLLWEEYPLGLNFR